MKEYVDLGLLKKRIHTGMNIIEVMQTIMDLPVADVVEVVRCRDCAKREICRTSNTWAVAPSDDWYCADGERGMDGGVNDG